VADCKAVQRAKENRPDKVRNMSMNFNFGNVTKKVVALTSTTVIAGTLLVVGGAAANAAVKVNTKCAVAGQSALAAGKKVTCVANPASATGALIWGGVNCVSAVKSYTASLNSFNTLNSSSQTTIANFNTKITTVTADEQKWQAKVDQYNSDLTAYLAKNPTQSSSDQVTSFQKSINTLQQSVTNDKNAITSYQNAIQQVQTQLQPQQDTVNQAKKYAVSICKKGN
jgi:peptidoglycan hydrolase CwlO-like protein